MRGAEMTLSAAAGATAHVSNGARMVKRARMGALPGIIITIIMMATAAASMMVSTGTTA